VSSVEKGGPAERAGLQPGDVIRQVNGQRIVSSGDLPALIALASPGDKLAIEVWRKGGSEKLEASLAKTGDKSAKADTEGGRPGRQAGPGAASAAAAGAPADRRRRCGLLVQDARGAAARAGVQQGDVLLAVNGTSVRSVEQVREAVAKSDKSVALLIQRGEQRILCRFASVDPCCRTQPAKTVFAGPVFP
jgi:serine protease Do